MAQQSHVQMKARQEGYSTKITVEANHCKTSFHICIHAFHSHWLVVGSYSGDPGNPQASMSFLSFLSSHFLGTVTHPVVPKPSIHAAHPCIASFHRLATGTLCLGLGDGLEHTLGVADASGVAILDALESESGDEGGANTGTVLGGHDLDGVVALAERLAVAAALPVEDLLERLSTTGLEVGVLGISC